MRDDNPEDFLDDLDHSSNWSVMGPKLWWMLTARAVLRVWPSATSINDTLARRKAVLHEELRIRVARQRLGDAR